MVPYTKIDHDILSPPYILNLPPLRMIVRYFATQNDSSQKQNYFYTTTLYNFEASGLCCYLLNNLQISYDHNFGSGALYQNFKVHLICLMYPPPFKNDCYIFCHQKI